MLGAPSACFTCGLPAAEMTCIYRQVVQILYARGRKMREKEGKRDLPITEGTGPNGAPIVPESLYNALGVSDCCRSRISAAMDIRDYLPEEEIIPQ